MKKFFAVAALLLFPLFASAQGDALLTAAGEFYTIEEQSSYAAGAAQSQDSVQLLLTIRRGTEIQRQIVPGTLTPGVHSNAALAYDSESGILYIFWLRHVTMLESHLYFTSIDKDGNWSEATQFGQPFDYRENLRIAVTRKVVTEGDKLAAGVTVHATWWETDTHTGDESAKYAAIAIENGRVEVNYLDLEQFVGTTSTSMTKEELSVLRHPILFASPKQESVLLTFGDFRTGRLNRVRVYPVRPPASNGRIRIPVGRGDGSVGAPRFNVAANSNMNAVVGENDNMAFYVREDAKLNYVVLRDGKWCDSRSIVLDQQITAPAAIDAIRRLVNEN